jgi:aspartate/methionine/tyrosine aminotransferase
MEFAYRMNGIDSSPIRKAFELARSIENPINLSIGQPHFPCPPNIIEALCRAAQDGKTAYTLTGGIPELKEAMTEKYQIQNGISYAHPDSILVTSGISSALFLLFNALVNADDECLVISPYFLMYPAMLKFYGAKLLTVDESFQKNDLDPFRKKKIKLIIFSNPSNPTGKVISRDQLRFLAELAEETGAYLISDEIYELFDYDKAFYSIGKEYPKTITLTGFSKTYNMTGLRLATILAPPEVIKALTTLQQYTVVCAPSVTQWAGIEALKTDMSSYIQDYREKRDFVYDSLKDYYEVQKSGGAFYYFIKVKERDEEFIQKAVQKKLILVPGFIFTESRNYVRLSFATEWETLKRGMKALQELAT